MYDIPVIAQLLHIYNFYYVKNDMMVFFRITFNVVDVIIFKFFIFCLKLVERVLTCKVVFFRK